MYLKCIKSIKLVSVVLLLASMSLFAQKEPGHKEAPHFRHHRIALFTGYGLINDAIDEDGNKQVRVIPVMGFDYEYFINHKIGVGLFNDIELSSYGVEGINDEYLQREYAFVTAAVFLYEPLIGWTLFGGPGYEFEKHHGFPLLKIGTELAKNFSDGWSVGIAASFDFKEVNSSLSLGLSVVKALGK